MQTVIYIDKFCLSFGKLNGINWSWSEKEEILNYGRFIIIFFLNQTSLFTLNLTQFPVVLIASSQPPEPNAVACSLNRPGLWLHE